MKAEDRLKDKFGQDPGFRVPDGYFDEIFTKISDSLPERKVVKPAPLTRWQRIKPYVYLAAMFAGIWCMMKMFHMMTTMPEVSLDNPPVVVAEALSQPEVMEEIVPLENESDYEIVTELQQEYANFEEFEEDFDYQLEEEYAEIDLSELKVALEFDEEPIVAQTSEEDLSNSI